MTRQSDGRVAVIADTSIGAPIAYSFAADGYTTAFLVRTNAPGGTDADDRSIRLADRVCPA
ncbi:hypothetical protein [Micromonospora chersina]|uniref:hypothetical protein n=1 Tax=Micromonospora chersina TaxID=47854 RepID=UPI0036C0D5ED